MKKDKSLAVLVAGGSGFCGAYVLNVLREKNIKAIVLARGKQAFHLPVHDNLATIVHCDTTHPITSTIIQKIQDHCHGYQIAALINLVGIKCENSTQTFHKVHVGTVQHLVDLTTELSIPKFIHMSVMSAFKDTTAPQTYHHTKFLGEELILRAYQQKTIQDYCILRPSIVWGVGDDMVRNIVRGMKHFAIFPLPAPAKALHQPIHVIDVANEIVRHIEISSAEEGEGIIQLLGPEVLPLHKIISIVASALRLPSFQLPLPYSFLSFGVTMMSKIPGFDPLITPAQLRMLHDGMSQEQKPLQQTPATKTILGDIRYTTDALRRQEEEKPSGTLFGFSTRLLSTTNQWEQIDTFSSLFTFILCLVVCFPVLFAFAVSFFPFAFLQTLVPHDYWFSAMVMHGVALVFQCIFLHKYVLTVIQPTASKLSFAVVLGLCCALVAIFGNELICSLFPALEYRFECLKSFWSATEVSIGVRAFLAFLFLVSEELTFRCMVLLPICSFIMKRRSLRPFGGWISCFLSATLWGLINAFTLGATVAPLMFSICVVMGTFWGAFFLKTNDLLSTVLTRGIFGAIMVTVIF